MSHCCYLIAVFVAVSSELVEMHCVPEGTSTNYLKSAVQVGCVEFIYHRMLLNLILYLHLNEL